METFAILGQSNAVVSADHRYQSYGSTVVYAPQNLAGGDADAARAFGLLVNMGDYAPLYRYYALRQITLQLASAGSWVSLSGRLEANSARFPDDGLVTYDSRPESALLVNFSGVDFGYGGYSIVARETVTQQNARAVSDLIRNGFFLTDFIGFVYAGGVGTEPLLQVECEPVTLTVAPVSPVFTIDAPTFIPQTQPAVFSWTAAQPEGDITMEPVLPVSTVLRWREQGSEDVSEFVINGPRTSFEFLAHSFPGGYLEWQVVVTANSGTVSSSEWTQFMVVPPMIMGASPAAGGYVPKHQNSTFRWDVRQYLQDGTTVDIAQQSAIFRWRETGSADVHTLSVGAETQVTVPAGTFVSDSIDWQVAATTVHGVVATSGWYTCTTVEAQSSARAISPKSTAVDGSAPVVFRWEHIIPTGTAQTAFELETSPDSAQWQALATAETAETTYTAPAGTFGGGDLYWRVRTRNTDGVFGEWSEPAYCIVLLAPPTPAISVESAAPRFVIRWAQEGQEAFEVTLNGVVVARSFGRNAYYRHAEFLSDGNYMVGVRVQNKYGLWSSTGTASIAIRNTEVQRVALQAVSLGTETALSWSLPAPYSRALVYRNGVLIADKVGLSELVDYFAPETAMYQVRAAVPDGAAGDNGMYAQSDIVSVTSPILCLMITAVEQPLWLKIAMADASLRKLTTTMRRDVGYVNGIDGGLPTAAVGADVSRSLQVPCAFRANDVASALALEALLGQIVCVRSPQLDPAFYVLERLNRSQNIFLRSYTLTLTQVSHDEVIR